MARNQRGSALVLAVFLVVVLTLLGIGVVTTATTDLKISDSYTRSVRAMYITDAGVNHAVALIQNDPTFGNITPNPSGTPYFVQRYEGGSYSIWVWNKRVWGNGVTDDFDVPGSRQVIVLGSDGKSATRKVGAIVAPARQAPRAMRDWAVFSCGDLAMGGADVQGAMYASGNITWNGVSPKYVHAEATGNFTGTKNIKAGHVWADGNITNSSCTVDLECKAGGTVSTVSKCKKGATASMSPVPVKEYCDPSDAGWDPTVLNLTQAEIQAIRDTATATAGHSFATGWSVTSGTLNLSGKYWVQGLTNFKTNTIKYTGDTTILVDGDFLCDSCVVSMGTTGSYFNVITSSGDITFQGAKKSSYIGVLWAGVWNDTTQTPPAMGSITVKSAYDLKIKGEAVATVGPITNSSIFHVYLDSGKPPTFGEISGYAVSEWLEMR